MLNFLVRIAAHDTASDSVAHYGVLGKAPIAAMSSETVARLPWPEHAQHQHVACRPIVPRIRHDGIEHAVPFHGSFADPFMFAHRVAAGVARQIADSPRYCPTPCPGTPTRTGLAEPGADGFKVLFRRGREADGTRHGRSGLLRLALRR